MVGGRRGCDSRLRPVLAGALVAATDDWPGRRQKRLYGRDWPGSKNSAAARPLHRSAGYRLGDRLAVPAGHRSLRPRRQHPGPDLRHARLGAEHRRRPRRPARPRLRRLLCSRRLQLRAAVDALRLELLDLPAAGGPVRRLVRRDAGLSGAAAARRLSRHRHPRLRRDDPDHPDQLAEADQRTERHHRYCPAVVLRHSVHAQSGTRPACLSHPVRTRLLAAAPDLFPLLPDPGARAAHQLPSPCASASCRSAGPGRRCAKTRSPAGRSASTRPTPS